MSKDNSTEIAMLLVSAANRLDLQQATNKTRDILGELLSYLKALRECYQAMHWTARGEPYYGDHQLFGRLYEELLPEIDGLAEKSIGYTDDAYVVDVQYQTARLSSHVNEIMSHLPDMTNIQCMLRAEQKLCKDLLPKMLNSMEQARELSDGLENFLQGIADKHEGTMYHLQRRLKTQKDMSAMDVVEPNISPPPEVNQNVEQEFEEEMQSAEQP